MVSENSFIIIIIISLLIIGSGAFFYKKLFNVSQDEESNNEDEFYKVDNSEYSESNSIFYQYNHNSDREWLEWINTQDDEIRTKAINLLKQHLNGLPKFWGYITLEALECFKGFQDKEVDKDLAEFFKRCSKIWHEYKSIPNYYQKTAEVLAHVNPSLAMELFNEELFKGTNTQMGVEKRRIIIDILPLIGELVKDIMVDILVSSSESYGTKTYSLKKCEKFDPQIKSYIHINTLKKLTSKYKDSHLEMKAEEGHFLQDLMEECMKKISKYEFFEVIKDACKNSKFQRLIIKHILRELSSTNKVLSQFELYALANLEDNSQNDIKKALAKFQQLDAPEINNIILQEITQDTNRDDLLIKDSEELILPIPSSIQEQYEKLKSAFFSNVSDHEYVTSEKIFGGVLILGDDPLEKLYFCRSLAKEKNWNFAVLDLTKLESKNDFENASKIFVNLRKPYLLYIINPQLLLERDGGEKSGFRERLLQLLSVQSLDTKSFLAGDIMITSDKVTNSSLGDKVGLLRSRFFPQILEINKRPNTVKHEITEKYIKFISRKRFENRTEISNQLFEQGKEMSVIEFTFFVIDTLKTMLLVFGKDVPLKDIKKIKTDFPKNLELGPGIKSTEQTQLKEKLVKGQVIK